MATFKNTLLASSKLKLSLVVSGAALAFVACSEAAEPDTGAGSVGTMTSGGLDGGTTGVGGMTSTQAATTMGSTVTGVTTTSAVTSSAVTSAGGMSATGAGGSSTAGATTGSLAGAGGMSTTGMGGATSTDMGAGGSTMSGAGGGMMGMDVEVTAEDFDCIADWDQVLGFRITNILGNVAESVAVAQNGGVYPVGTLIQHLPTEAMVKHAEGFSPETKDWEFFLLQISAAGTTISDRGTTEIQTMGSTCASCHALAPDEYDFVCNTWGELGGDNCGFDFDQGTLDSQIASDPRCD